MTQHENIIRECTITDIPVLLRIAHGHLDPAYRLENSSESREKISFTISVFWHESKINGFEQLFNYAALYRILQTMHDRVLTGPLESVLDEIETTLQAEAAAQSIRMTETRISMQRPDLLHGHVRLSKTTRYS